MVLILVFHSLSSFNLTGVNTFSFPKRILFKGTVCAKGEKLDLEGTSTRLRKAMKGFGTDEKVIIDVLASHCNYELQLIKERYKTLYGRVG